MGGIDVWKPSIAAHQAAIEIIMRNREIAEERALRDEQDRQKMMELVEKAQQAKIKYAQDMLKTAYEKGDEKGVRTFGEPLRQGGFPVPAQEVAGPAAPGKLPPVEYFGAPQRQANVSPTDVDDFVSDAEKESMRLTGKGLTPGQRNEARLKFKRAQATEIRMNRFASRDVDAQTAGRIKYNEGIGKALAEIETAGRLIKAKGEETPEQKQMLAKNRMTGNLATIANHYIKLDSMGAILNVDKNAFQNIEAALKSSSLGQSIGRITGSDAQSIRSAINKLKPLLIQDIRQSTNMSARGLDSEKELEFYLQAATDEKTDIQSNIAAIVVLDEAYGTGQTAERLRSLTNESLIKRISSQGNKILNSGSKKAAPKAAVDYLKSHPELIEDFVKKYGYRPEGF